MLVENGMVELTLLALVREGENSVRVNDASAGGNLRQIHRCVASVEWRIKARLAHGFLVHMSQESIDTLGGRARMGQERDQAASRGLATIRVSD